MHKILSILADSPDAIFIDSNDGMVSYQQAENIIRQKMEILSTIDAKTVAIFADNQVDWIFFDLACQCKNICCIPLPLFFSNEQLQHAITTANVDVIITDQKWRISQLNNLSLQDVLADNLLTDNSVSDISSSYEIEKINQLAIYKIRQSTKANKPEKTEKITFTSGSTGDPKGVCLTSKQQWQVAQSLVKVVDIKQPRHLCILPLSTLLENIAGVYAPMLVGGTIIIRPMTELGFNGNSEFQLEKLLNTIEHTQPNTIVLLPQLLLALVVAAESGWKVPTSLKFIAVGGGKVATHLIQRALQCQLPVYEGYGLSECVSVVSLNSPYDNKPGSVGKPLPHVKVEIHDTDIVASGETFLGYLNEPNSWGNTVVDTGDTGYLDEDGFLYIDGRKKNILVSSYGRNINPEWVESQLLSHPLVQQCVVFGDAKPYCSALIFPRQTDIEDSLIQLIVDEANKHLPDYAHIHSWKRLNKPLTPDDGLLTTNGRPRRIHIANYYQEEIEAMYHPILDKKMTTPNQQVLNQTNVKQEIIT